METFTLAHNWGQLITAIRVIFSLTTSPASSALASGGAAPEGSQKKGHDRNPSGSKDWVMIYHIAEFRPDLLAYARTSARRGGAAEGAERATTSVQRGTGRRSEG